MRTLCSASSVPALALALSALVASCTPRAPAPPTPPTPPDATSPTPATPAPIAPRIEGPLGALLDNYEAARVRLTQDDQQGAVALAAQLQASAAAAAAEAPAGGATRQPLLDATGAAERMMKGADLAAVRLAFGELSKAIVALLVADPTLQTGRFLMLCPMAKGYQKWVQTSPSLTNPYWGKEMLECGEQLKTWAV